MIKKTLILASLLAFTVTGALAADVPTKQAAQTQTTASAQERPEFDAPPPPPPSAKAKANFEKRLKLTTEQKELANQLRLKGQEDMKTVFEKMNDLRAEKEALLKTKMAAKMQQEKIAEIDAKVKDLRKQAHELRMKNMKDFESILTDKQKKELKKMKEEGRKEFEKARAKCEKKCSCPMDFHRPPAPPEK